MTDDGCCAASQLLTSADGRVSCDKDFLYVPNFISVDEEQQFLFHLYNQSADNRTQDLPVKWTVLRRRRLVNLGGSPDPKGMLAEKIPLWVRCPIADRIETFCGPQEWSNGIAPQSTGDASLGSSTTSIPSRDGDSASRLVVNHVLINEYVAPCGIMPHEDGPLYRPIVAIVSMASPAVLWFSRKGAVDTVQSPSEEHAEPPRALVLQPRSLVCFRGALYTDFLHSIEEAELETVPLGQCLNRDSIVPASPNDSHHQKDGRIALVRVNDSTDAFQLVRGEKRVSVTYRQVKRVLKVSASAIFGTR